MSGERDGIFWKIRSGEIPPPAAGVTLGMDIVDVDPEAGTIEVAFEATDAFLNPAGTVQGGFLSAMLDDTMGPCMLATLGGGEIAPTVNLNVSFVSPARPGRLVGTARITGRSGGVISAVGTLTQNDKVVATGAATALIRAVR